MTSYPKNESFGTATLNCSRIVFAQIQTNSLPCELIEDKEQFIPHIVDMTVTRLIALYAQKSVALLPLREQAAIAYLKHIHVDEYAFFDMEELVNLKYIPFHLFKNRKAIKMWRSLELLYTLWKEDVQVKEIYIVFDDGKARTPTELMINDHELSFGGSFVVSSTPAMYPSFTTITEIGRVFTFENYCRVSYDMGAELVVAEYHHHKLLQLCGDVESNPGPNTFSKLSSDEKVNHQSKQINIMQREIAKLRAAQAKQNHCIQRQIELEKRDRKKRREEGSDKKRYAQGTKEVCTKLVSDIKSSFTDTTTIVESAKAGALVAANIVAPGAGTAVATIVHGSKVTKAVNQLNPTISMLQDVLKTLSSAGEELRNLFKIPQEYDLLGILISFASISSAVMSRQLFSLTLHCTQLARQLQISIDSLLSLIPNMTGFASGVGSVFFKAGEAQVAVGQSLITDMFETAKQAPELLPFSGFLSFLCGAFTLMCSGTLPTPGEMTKHFSNIGRAAQGFKALKDMFNWISDYLSEIYYTTVYGLSVEEYKFMENFPQVENCYAACQIIEKLDKAVVDGSAAIANQILTVNHQLNEYYYQASKMNSASNRNLISSLQKRIKDQTEWATHCPARCHTVRVAPLSIYMFGEPGVGKSVATDVLKARIFKTYLKDKGISYDTCSYPRRANNEYWEGYTGQPIVILDDFGNVKDTVMKPVEQYEELEHMVNTTQFPLKMAELKSKGVSNFTSEFIIASSNSSVPQIVSLTNPGAVFRRFHIWAEFTIDPRYGKPIGKDSRGKKYYTFDKETVAAYKKIDVGALNPLETEHYRINCYTVSYDKQKGCAVMNYTEGKQGISFDEFWEFIKQKNDRMKNEGDLLANAIRAEAGIEKPEKPHTEAKVMSEFDKIFRPEKFIAALAEEESFDGIKGLADLFVETEEDTLFGSISEYFTLKTRKDIISKHFDEARTLCHNRITSFYSKLKALVNTATNKLLSIAEFLMSVVTSVSNTITPYFPSVPTSKVLTGLFSTVVAIFGVWYTGVFCSKSSTNHNNWCQFNKSPSEGDTPCGKCSACQILQYPKTGDMLVHYLERTGIKSVRKDLLGEGFPSDKLEEIREEIRVRPQRKEYVKQECRLLHHINTTGPCTTAQEANKLLESKCWYNCTFCDSISPHDLLDDASRLQLAQRVYETQPRVPVAKSYAQRVYDNGVRPGIGARYAQGLVECKTEMHIGARKYAQRDLVQIEQTTQVLLNNSVWVQVVDTRGNASRSNGVFLVGRTMLTTAHTVMSPPSDAPISRIVIRNPYSTTAAIDVPIEECNISQLKQLDGSPLDLALISFPPVVPNRPKILSKFVGAKDIGLLDEGSLTFSGFYEVNGKTIVQEKYPSSFAVSTKATEYYLHKPGTCPNSDAFCTCPIRIGNHITYDLETMNGMCGALLSVKNSLLHTKLIGFHVAGGTGVMAIGALATRELLESSLEIHVERFGIPKSYLIDGRLPYSQSWVDPTKQVSLINIGDCLNVGTAKSPTTPSVTQLGASLVFDKIQTHTTKPANLKAVYVEGEGIVDPMIKGIKKVMGPQQWIDPDILEAAASDVFQGLGQGDGKGIVHSYVEAIVGVEGDAYKRPINRTTSPGYPYNLVNKSKGKTAWLGDGEEYITDNAELRNDVDALLEKAKQGIRGDAISIATLKDEKRPIAKVDAGKTRVFEACPQHLVIAIRQYFLDFTAHVMRNRIDNGIAVGINPYSLEWTKLAHRLQTQGDNLIAGDFSNFDGSLLMQVLVKILEKINKWYGGTDEDNLVRAALWEHICNADILVKGEVIRKTHSQPSGNPLTVIINSLFNGIVMRVAYLNLKKENGMPAVCDYRKHVTEIIYGDDDIKSVSCSIKNWFNQLTLTEALAKFGLTYTDETKTGIIVPFKPLTEVAFLKRKFVVQNDGTFLAPMDVENILEITNWIKGKAKRLATVENCEQAIMELAQHPRAVYEQWSDCVQSALNAVGIKFVVPTYFEQMEQYKHDRNIYSSKYVPLW